MFQAHNLCINILFHTYGFFFAVFSFKEPLFPKFFCTFAPRMEENIDIAQMLAQLHELQGIDFVRQLRLITERNEFSPLKDNPLIYTVGGEWRERFAFTAIFKLDLSDHHTRT